MWLVRVSCNHRRQFYLFPNVAAYFAGGVHGAVPPPAKPTNPRSGSQWHEIEHDGFRIIARESGAQVRPYNRPGIGQLVIGAAPYRKGAVTSPGRMFLQPGGRGAYPIPPD
jgi:hypothetical protein